MSRVRLVLVATLALAAARFVADACGVDLLPRAHLNDQLWRPLARRQTSFAVSSGVVLPGAFAGMAKVSGDTPIDLVRKAYQAGLTNPETDFMGAADAIDATREALANARRADPDAITRDELDLVELKVRLREQERELVDPDWPALTAAFDAFLARTLLPAVASEARGWRARCLYLGGRPVDAAKAYIDESARPDTVLDADTLYRSLRLLYQWNGTSTDLLEDLEQFFDTPAHAVFAVTLLTNPVSDDGIDWEVRLSGATSASSRTWGYPSPEAAAATASRERAGRVAYRERIASRALAVLEGRTDLFRGPDGEALAAALMRVALYRGDAQAALRYHERLAPTSLTRQDPDVRWQRAAALGLLGRTREAREVLGPLMNDETLRGTALQRAAARGTIDLSMQLGDNVSALHAALRYPHILTDDPAPTSGRWMTSVVDGVGWPLDLPYLLDVWMSDADLDRARATLPHALLSLPSPVVAWKGARLTIGQELDYARAVRLARAERYSDAATLYAKAGNATRAARMLRAADVFARAAGTAATTADRIAYARFLAEHPDQLFFHDRLYGGLQRYMLGTNYECRQDPCEPLHFDEVVGAMPEPQRRQYTRRERRFRDRQEERWRAVQVLLDVVKADAGTNAGRTAARLALDCLVRIRTDRFGREADIAGTQRRLHAWLRAHPA